MRAFVSLLSATALFVLASCAKEDAATTAPALDMSAELKSRVTAAFKPLIKNTAGKTLGGYDQIAVGVIVGDEIDFYGFSASNSAGLEAEELQQRPSADTIFELGGSSQVFTALSYAQLVADKTIDIYATVDSILTKTKIPSHKNDKIRLEHLASHFSRLPLLPTNIASKTVLGQNPLKGYDAKRFQTFLSSYQLPSTPGKDFEYSLTGIGLLAASLSEFHQQPIAKLHSKTLFQPLKMNDTRYTLTKEQKERLAHGYYNGKLVDHWNYNALSGAGGIKSSVNDLLLFVKAQLEPKEMGSDDLAAAIELAQEPRGQYPEGTMAMGWHIAGKNHPYYYWTSGHTAGSQSFIAFSRHNRGKGKDKAKFGLVVLTNSIFSMSSDERAYELKIRELSRQIMDAVSKRPESND